MGPPRPPSPPKNFLAPQNFRGNKILGQMILVGPDNGSKICKSPKLVGQKSLRQTFSGSHFLGMQKRNGVRGYGKARTPLGVRDIGGKIKGSANTLNW